MIMKKYLKKSLYSIYAHSGKNLSQFKGVHLGESCYIFGDGVSSKWFDLSVFSDKPAFILAYFLFQKKMCDIGRPVYGVLAEPYYFYPYFRIPKPSRALWRNRIQARYRQRIQENLDIDFFVNLSNYLVLRGKNVHYTYQSIYGSEFSQYCLSQGLDPFAGSFRVGISLAIFMGFSKIFLVGCDYTHKQSRSKHWYEYGHGVLYAQPHYNKDFFDLAKDYVDITTITLEGEGTHLASIEYEQYANKPPMYVENFDLMDKEDLLLMDTWPGYDIFPN